LPGHHEPQRWAGPPRVQVSSRLVTGVTECPYVTARRLGNITNDHGVSTAIQGSRPFRGRFSRAGRQVQSS
ncbi:MAG TPA: hypothetical protein PLT69_12430, partial [Deltaproteobacteria bacterium]|nr:hypothetical protein [Deltaproteobacteria bacterium]